MSEIIETPQRGWYRDRECKRVIRFVVGTDNENETVINIDSNGYIEDNTIEFFNQNFEPYPECTGFDYVPPVPLTDKEKEIKQAFEQFIEDIYYKEWYNDATKIVAQCDCCSWHMGITNYTNFINKMKQLLNIKD